MMKADMTGAETRESVIELVRSDHQICLEKP